MSTSHVIKMLSGFSHDGFPTGRLALTHFKLRSPSVLTTWFPSFEMCTFRKKSQGTQVERHEPTSLAQASRREGELTRKNQWPSVRTSLSHTWRLDWKPEAFWSQKQPRAQYILISLNVEHTGDRSKPWTDSMSCAGCSSRRMLQADPP